MQHTQQQASYSMTCILGTPTKALLHPTTRWRVVNAWLRLDQSLKNAELHQRGCDRSNFLQQKVNSLDLNTCAATCKVPVLSFFRASWINMWVCTASTASKGCFDIVPLATTYSAREATLSPCNTSKYSRCTVPPGRHACMAAAHAPYLARALVSCCWVLGTSHAKTQLHVQALHVLEEPVVCTHKLQHQPTLLQAKARQRPDPTCRLMQPCMMGSATKSLEVTAYSWLPVLLLSCTVLAACTQCDLHTITTTIWYNHNMVQPRNVAHVHACTHTDIGPLHSSILDVVHQVSHGEAGVCC